MQYLLTDFQNETAPYAYWDNAFTNDELNYIQQLAVQKTNQPAVVGGQGNGIMDSSIRRSSVGWLEMSNEHKWIFDKLAYVVSSINSSIYRYDLTGFGEALQLTNYNQNDMGMYSWHQDFGGTVSRKLSLVLQLSDPVDYEGGVLEIMTTKQPMQISKRRGLITLFPSFTLHQVTPVTMGSRQSLVCWITGPQFK